MIIHNCFVTELPGAIIFLATRSFEDCLIQFEGLVNLQSHLFFFSAKMKYFKCYHCNDAGSLLTLVTDELQIEQNAPGDSERSV